MSATGQGSPLFPRDDGPRLLPPPFFWSAVVLLFCVVHFPHDRLITLTGAIVDTLRGSEKAWGALRSLYPFLGAVDSHKIVSVISRSVLLPTRKIAFIVSVCFLAYPILIAARRAHWVWEPVRLRRRSWKALKLFLGLSFLVIPLGLRGFGLSYGTLSLEPFGAPFNLFYRRILMPGIASIVGMNGYVYYFVFSMLCTYLFIHALLTWFESRDVELKPLHLLSLMTSGFVIHNFQWPGYTEQCAFLLILAAATVPMTAQGRLAMIALSLAAHEASILALIPIVLVAFRRSEWKNAGAVIAVYAILFLLCNAGDVSRVVQLHLVPDGGPKTVLQMFADNPFLVLLGVACSYKLLWFICAIVLARLFLERSYVLATGIAVMVFFPLIFLPGVLDMSRWPGFGFYGVLLCVQLLVQHSYLNRTLFDRLMLFNLLLPSAYVGLDHGVLLQPGLYRVLFGWMM